jgi:SAM-dependent methyltransferase
VISSIEARRAVRRTALALVFAALAASPSFAQGGRVDLFPPEDLGLLEGPDRDAWQRPEEIMDALGIADGSHVADIGAGGGWFTIRLARRVGPAGLVFGQDVQPEMIDAIERRMAREGLSNVKTVLGAGDDPRLPTARLDAILVVDAYGELANPVTMLRRMAAALKPNGRIGIVDWKKEGGGPGPPLEARTPIEDVIEDARRAGLRVYDRDLYLPFQYLLVLTK